MSAEPCGVMRAGADQTLPFDDVTSFTWFDVIPVNPGHTEILGLPCYPDLASIPKDVKLDIVDVFRRSEFVPEIVEAATREAAANLTKTNPTWEEYLNLLATRCGLPKFVPAFNCQDPAMSRVKPRRLRRSNESRDVLLRCSLSPLLHPALIATLTKVRP